MVTADRDATLLTRLSDLRQARHTSNIEDIRIWKDAAGMNPARDLRKLLAELGLGAAKLGVELDSYGLKAHHGRLMEAELVGCCTLTDASTLIDGLRSVKSPREIEEDNPQEMQAGNVFFLHMIVMNSDTGRAMTLGHSVLVTENGCERLSRSSLDLVVG